MSFSPQSHTWQNKILGRYQLRSQIGVGGMGEVWLAEDPALQRQIAIKTLPLKDQGDNEFLRRFELEARAAAALNHPHILPIHDFGTQSFSNGQTMTYLVMPYISGGSLAERMDYYTRLRTMFPLNEALEYLSQAADAIDYAHTQGVIHRDIKPGNMLLRNNEWLLLTDFGIARMLSSDEKLTRTGVGFGTPEYMAPEQAQGRAEASSDNYSLAVLAYRLLSGQLPFSAENSYATTMQHIMNPPPPPGRFNPAISPALERAILHGLEKVPANRPATARDFVNELKTSLTSPLLEATVGPAHPYQQTNLPETDPPQYSQKSKKDLLTRREVLIGGGALLLVGAGAAIWAGTNHSSGTPLPGGKTTATKPAVNANQYPAEVTYVLLGHNAPVKTLTWSSQGHQLYSSGSDQRVKLWDIDVNKQGQQITRASTKTLNLSNIDTDTVLASSPDGKYVAVGNIFPPDAANNPTNKSINVYKPDLSGFAAGFEKPISLTNVGTLEGLIWGPGKYLIASTTDSNINSTTTNFTTCTLTDPTLGPGAIPPLKIKANLGGSGSPSYITRRLSISPDGSKLALASTDGGPIVGTIGVTGHTALWQLFATPKFNLARSALCVAWSPDNHYLAAISYPDDTTPQELVLWDMTTKAADPTPYSLPGDQVQLTHLTWSPAPTSIQLAASDKSGTIYIWNASPNNVGNRLPARTINGLSNEISDLAWSADGNFLAASYKDINDSILIWRM